MDSSSRQNSKRPVKVRIKYLVTLRDQSGRKEEEADFPPGTTLRDVADWLNERHAFSLPNARVMAVLNGKGWEQLPEKLATEIQDGDTICLFPLLSGG